MGSLKFRIAVLTLSGLAAVCGSLAGTETNSSRGFKGPAEMEAFAIERSPPSWNHCLQPEPEVLESGRAHPLPPRHRGRADAARLALLLELAGVSPPLAGTQAE